MRVAPREPVAGTAISALQHARSREPTSGHYNPSGGRACSLTVAFLNIAKGNHRRSTIYSGRLPSKNARFLNMHGWAEALWSPAPNGLQVRVGQEVDLTPGAGQVVTTQVSTDPFGDAAATALSVC